MALAALWHGPNKPNFEVFLSKIVFELKTVLNRTFDFEEIGKIRFVARSIVCDMHTAYCLSMYQHMGYFSCTFCLMKGIRHNNRMIFPVKAPICLRTEESFVWCAQQSFRRSRPVLGIKDNYPFNEVFSFTKDAPIDAMHQVFLGTVKILTKMIISVLKKIEVNTFKLKLKKYSFPLDFQHRSKNIDDLNHWKAADFKLFFFHLGPLILSKTLLHQNFADQLQSYRCLSSTIRLLSGKFVTETQIENAENLIFDFFEDFVKNFGINLQSFNFHAMRHLPDQVREMGPLASGSS